MAVLTSNTAAAASNTTDLIKTKATAAAVVEGSSAVLWVATSPTVALVAMATLREEAPAVPTPGLRRQAPTILPVHPVTASPVTVSPVTVSLLRSMALTRARDLKALDLNLVPTTHLATLHTGSHLTADRSMVDMEDTSSLALTADLLNTMVATIKEAMADLVGMDNHRVATASPREDIMVDSSLLEATEVVDTSNSMAIAATEDKSSSA
jgi:hypothetical protein